MILVLPLNATVVTRQSPRGCLKADVMKCGYEVKAIFA
jgi:hypothetical protein